MAITQTTVEGYLETAVTAVEDDDFSKASKNVAKAIIAFAALPDAGNEGASMRFNRSVTDIRTAIDDARQAFNRDNVPSRISRGVTRFRS